jgi:hypothetical protein
MHQSKEKRKKEKNMAGNTRKDRTGAEKKGESKKTRKIEEMVS